MERSKKIIAAINILIMLIVVAVVYKSQLGNNDMKEIHVVIMNENNKIYDQRVTTQASTLAKLLEEMDEKNEILLECENSTYGMYITGMGVDELYMQDETQGLYWTYDSSNNAQCQKNAFCDAADLLVIEDQDEFVFTLKGFDE